MPSTFAPGFFCKQWSRSSSNKRIGRNDGFNTFSMFHLPCIAIAICAVGAKTATGSDVLAEYPSAAKDSRVEFPPAAPYADSSNQVDVRVVDISTTGIPFQN